MQCTIKDIIYICSSRNYRQQDVQPKLWCLGNGCYIVYHVRKFLVSKKKSTAYWYSCLVDQIIHHCGLIEKSYGPLIEFFLCELPENRAKLTTVNKL